MLKRFPIRLRGLGRSVQLICRYQHVETSYPEGWENPKPVTSNSDTPHVATEYLSKILTSQVYDVAIDTPIHHASYLSSIKGNQYYFKREDLQPVFSFKIRGAHNKIASLSNEVRGKGVVACSAGNHAQGVALSAARLGIRATIVMPLATPTIKYKAVQRFGGAYAKVKLFGQNYDEAAAEAKRLVLEEHLTMIHPFDDPYVIAGQGTIGLEVIKGFNGKRLDTVFCCVGGGGLLAGMAAYIKGVRPDVKVIGVEADDAAGMTSSLIAGEVVTLPRVGLFADGAAVRTVGTETFRVCSQLVDGMITVTTDEICAAIKHGFNDTRTIMEPAGALAIAGMIKYSEKHKLKDHALLAISSGANMDFDRLRFVSERADSSELIFSVIVPERPGQIRRLYNVIHPRAVTEFSYRHNNSTKAHIVLSVKGATGVSLKEERSMLLSQFETEGMVAHDLSHNELAKLHVRHLAGGRCSDIKEGKRREYLYRLEFPEAPGALNKFLTTALKFTNDGWDISLFHYRNHGHDFGRVLIGILLEDDEVESFTLFLDNLGYTYFDESDNQIYHEFL